MKTQVTRISYLKVIPALIATLLFIYQDYLIFDPEIENIRILSHFFFLLLILYIIIRIDATIPNIIMVTTLITPLIELFRLFLLALLAYYLYGTFISSDIVIFLGFFIAIVPLLAISLALIDKLIFHKLGYRKAILPILLTSFMLPIAFGISPLELESIRNLLGLWIIPTFYVIFGPFFIKMTLKQDFNTEKVEDIFFVTFSLNSFAMSWFISKVYVEGGFALWGSFNYISILIIFASLLFPWSIYWAISEGFRAKNLKSFILLLLFYGFSFILISLSYIFPLGGYPLLFEFDLGVYPEWVFPSLFSILLYLLYGIMMPIIAIRRYRYASYLYSSIVFLLPLIAAEGIRYYLLEHISYIDEFLISMISVFSVTASFELLKKLIKSELKNK